eukprot:3071351-Pyramimonas_sp.AAC.1
MAVTMPMMEMSAYAILADIRHPHLCEQLIRYRVQLFEVLVRAIALQQGRVPRAPPYAEDLPRLFRAERRSELL